jgi:hypothetical protein
LDQVTLKIVSFQALKLAALEIDNKDTGLTQTRLFQDMAQYVFNITITSKLTTDVKDVPNFSITASNYLQEVAKTVVTNRNLGAKQLLDVKKLTDYTT